MIHPKHKHWPRILSAVLALSALLLALGATGGQLAQPERHETQADRWVGFHVVYEALPLSMEELESHPEDYPEEDRSHWVEYGSQDLDVDGLGTLAIPREILIGEYQEETGGYLFPGLEGYNAFLVARTLEDGSQIWGNSIDLAHAQAKVGGAEQSLSGIIYFGSPAGAPENWAEQESDYAWRAYNVYQMPDGTVYLDDSGNSYGISPGGMSFSSTATDTRTVNGESETSTLTVEVNMEQVQRLEAAAVKLFDAADRLLATQEFSPEEAEDAHVSLPSECAWVLVEERYEDASLHRTVYSPLEQEGQEEIAHSLVLLDERGMGRAVSLFLTLSH